MIEKLKIKLKEFKLLLGSIPVLSLFFVLSVIAMNLLANKSINSSYKYLALDCGVTVSWVAFLVMDIVSKHFGPKAATELSIFAILINAVFALIMFIGSVIPGAWGESYVEAGSEMINTALNNTFGGTWYVLLGSTVAFIVSAIINNFTNYGIGKLFKKNPDSVIAYISRSYVSTAIGQFADNITFAFLVSKIFFGWTILQCVACAFIGMIIELLCEVLFSGIGYKICQNFKKNDVGKEYFEYVKSNKTVRNEEN